MCISYCVVRTRSGGRSIESVAESLGIVSVAVADRDGVGGVGVVRFQVRSDELQER